MKIRSLIIVWCIFFVKFNLSSQNSLTNRQVWDFEIGDIFQYERSWNGALMDDGQYLGYFTNEVLNKEFSLNKDTIIYTFLETQYHAWSTMYHYSFVIEKTTILSIYDLDQVVLNYLNDPLDTCRWMGDSIGYGICNVNYRVVYSLPVEADCFERIYAENYAYEGLGAWYYYLNDANYATHYNKLIYYSKNGAS